MNKSDLETEKAEVEHFEKGSVDADAPSYDWLCAVQDGLNLFIHEYAPALMKVKNPKSLSVGEGISIGNSIAEDTKSATAETIVEQHTHVRLFLVTPPSDMTAHIYNLGR